MIKDFLNWHKLKEKIHYSRKRIVYFKERQIQWANLGLNVGFEQDGKNKNFERPVLILKKFNPDVLWILPLTSRQKFGKYYYQFKYKGKQYSIILSQLKLISSKRLLRMIRKISPEDFKNIKNCVKNIL